MSIRTLLSPNNKSWLDVNVNTLTAFNDILIDDTSLLNATTYGLSAGVISGFEPIVDNIDGSIDVPSGEVYLRSLNTDTAEIKEYDILAVPSLVLVDLVNNYVCVDYSGGVPVIINTTTFTSIDDNTRIQLYQILRDGTTLTITKRFQYGTNTSKKNQEFILDIHENTRTEGLFINGSGVRNILLSTGRIWTKLNMLVTPNFDTSGTDTFTRYYYNPSTFEQTLQTQFDNTTWNDTTSGLTALTASYWSYQELYILLNNTLISMYGQSEYLLEEDARLGTLIPIISPLTDHAVYVGRIVVQQGSATGIFLSPFIDVLGGGGAPSAGDHNALINLNTFDNHPRYAQLVKRGAPDTLDISNIKVDSLAESTPAGNINIINDIVTTGDITLDSNSISNELKYNQSAGVVSGFGITDTSPTVDIAQGVCYIRTSNSDTSPILEYTVGPTASISLTDNANNYIYIDYNGGAPIISSQVGGVGIKDNENDKFEIYECYRLGSDIHITPHFQYTGNAIKRTNRFLYSKFENTRTDGLILGESADTNMYVTMSAGTMWVKLNDIAISGIDTSGADTFRRYFYNGVAGTWGVQTAQSIWDNLQFDNIAIDGLTTLTNNRFSFQEFYIEADGDLVSVYGQAQYLSLGLAETASIISFLPPVLSDHSLYLGRIIFEKSDTISPSVLSVFTTELSSGGVTDHGSLTGLTDDDHLQYATLSARGAPDTLNIDTINVATINSTTTIQNTGTLKLESTTGGIDIDSVSGTTLDGGLQVDNMTVASAGTIALANEDLNDKIILKGSTHTMGVDTTNQNMRFNIPTGESYDFRINDVSQVTLETGQINASGDFNINAVSYDIEVLANPTLRIARPGAKAQLKSMTVNFLIGTNASGLVEFAQDTTARSSFNTGTGEWQMDTINDYSSTGIVIEGNKHIGGRLAINSTVTPSVGRFAIHGLMDDNGDGAHMAYITSEDAFPCQTNANYSHDNQIIGFDVYVSGGNWLSSYASSNFAIRKYSNTLNLSYSSSIPVGNVVTWSDALTISTSGSTNITGRVDIAGLVFMPGLAVNAGDVSVQYNTTTGELYEGTSTLESKMNIEPIDNPEWLYDVIVHKFNYRKTDENGDFTDIPMEKVSTGYIAEELVQIPEARKYCYYKQTPVINVNCPQHGEIKSEGECICSTENKLRGISYLQMVPELLRCIQLQRTEIENLRSDLTNLTTIVNGLI